MDSNNKYSPNPIFTDNWRSFLAKNDAASCRAVPTKQMLVYVGKNQAKDRSFSEHLFSFNQMKEKSYSSTKQSTEFRTKSVSNPPSAVTSGARYTQNHKVRKTPDKVLLQLKSKSVSSRLSPTRDLGFEQDEDILEDVFDVSMEQRPISLGIGPSSSFFESRKKDARSVSQGECARKNNGEVSGNSRCVSNSACDYQFFQQKSPNRKVTKTLLELKSKQAKTTPTKVLLQLKPGFQRHSEADKFEEIQYLRTLDG